jgi:lysophospholipase L1-like esterase
LLRLASLTLLCAAVLAAPALAQDTPTTTDATGATGAGGVLVVGDSLAVGLKPYLPALLEQEVTWDAKSGRTTPQGLVALRTALRTVKPKVVVISLGTNDGPDPARFRARIDKARAAIGPKTCIVWSLIYRPARKGPYAALNTVLHAEAGAHTRFHLVDWDRAVARRSVTLPDGLHPDAAGFAYRSRMIARTVRDGCGVLATTPDPTDPTAPTTTNGSTGGVESPDA